MKYLFNILLLMIILIFISCHSMTYVKDPGFGKIPIVIGTPDIGDYEQMIIFEHVITNEDIENGEDMITEEEYDNHSLIEIGIFYFCHKIVEKHDADGIINFDIQIKADLEAETGSDKVTIFGTVVKLK